MIMEAKTNYASIGIKPDEVKTWIFTFGYDHVHPVTGERLGNRFVRINGTLQGSRVEMARHFGDKWAMQYPGICEAGVHKWSLREIPLPEKCDDCGKVAVLRDYDADRGDPPQAVHYELCKECYEERTA